jgi:hypothetical protein
MECSDGRLPRLDSLLRLPSRLAQFLPISGPRPDGLAERPDGIRCNSFMRL